MPVFFNERGRWPLLSIFAAVVLVACASVPQDDQQPIQSPNDSNQYRFLTLDNELQVLLISDPDSPKAAAALDVMVGSGDNPIGRGGLAHFLEHMLFLGTDKYPDSAEYAEYVAEHGGNRNAYTSFEHTNYFFDINEAFLPEALDRFAQFFIAPRFDAEYVDREKNAVEAEYQMGLKSDSRRGLDVLQEVMNPQHPFSQFTVGSLETLADRPDSSVRDELLAFYAKHYSANAMRLVVLGSQSLDELETLVVPMFNEIPNRDYQAAEIAEPLFAPGTLPLFVQVEPQATLRQLQIAFPIDDYRAAYRVKPVSYVSNLVGHEGIGSLLSQLKAEGLAESLSAGSGLGWRGGALFSVNVSLTEKGAAQSERILQLLFAYMDMLRDQGPKEWLYDEQATSAGLAFRFRGDAEPMGYTSGLAAGMHYASVEDLLRAPYLMSDYDANMLSGLLNSIVPANALVTLVDKQVETNIVSKNYQVPYAQQSLPAEQLAAWQSSDKAELLTLPAANDFIADDVSLAPLVAANANGPQVVYESVRQKVWFEQDAEFRVPKGATYVNFRSPEVGQSAQQTAAAVLYTELLKDSVNEFSYPASLAGLNFSLYKHAQGISLRISGYNDKQAVLLDKILATTRTERFDQQRFTNIRRDMIRSLQNSVAKRPSSQTMDDLRESLRYGEWGEAALISALEEFDADSLAQYVQDFWRSARAEVLIYGNYSPEVVETIAAKIDTILTSDEPQPMPQLKVLRLAQGESLQYEVTLAHDDSVVAWYLQGEGDSSMDRAAAALTAQVTSAGFFQQLRTEQQLGYIASAFAWPNLDVPGLVMLIQSPTAAAPDVANAMDVYMRGVEGDLDADQFQRHQAALVTDILKPDKNLWERAEFYWQSIAKKDESFSGREELAEAVQAFTMESWLAYYNRVFLEQRHSLQVVAPGRWGTLPDGEFQQFDNAEAIKQGHQAYIIK